MGAIKLQHLTADDSTIRCEFDYPAELSGFFLETEFVTRYDVDISEVPESVLVIPWLANVCPIAWAKGVDVELPRLDERFAESLPALGRAFEEMYPQMIEGSEIRCEELVRNDAEAGTRGNNALLFSGGLDALDTYYRHRDEEPALITIRGFDVGLDDEAAWEAKTNRVESFSRSEGVRSFFVEANVMSFLESFMLNAHFRRFLQSDWYDAVHLGMGLTGVVAPLAFAQGFETIYMADSATEKFDTKVGNDPRIVNNVAWAGTSIQNDGYEFTRQEKIENVVEFLRENDLDLHTCLQPGPGNCGECEKCLRTAFGLVLAGLDPEQHGYPFDERRFEYARQRFESGDWNLAPSKADEWKIIREHAATGSYDYPGAEAFFEWLADVDIDQFVDSSNSSGFRAYKLTRRLPPSRRVHQLRRQVLDVIW